MYLKWIRLTQYVALGALFVFSGAAVLLSFLRDESFSAPALKSTKRQLPKSFFEFPSSDYVNLKPSAFYLNYIAPKMHLPDLRNSLMYYGQNGRPDLSMLTPKMFLGFHGGKNIIPSSYNEKIYLFYDKSLTTPVKYTFSPNNEPTEMWISASPEGKEALFSLEVRDPDKFAITNEDAVVKFYLPEKDFVRPSILGTWDMGKWRVDGSLLVRQKARWIGVDKFLENHGGSDFPDYAEKHRIDFGDGDDHYSLFLKKGDYLVWHQDKWHPCTNDCLRTDDKPLLVVKKIDEKVMSLELWDVEGKGKVGLTLVKSPESFHHEQITRSFRFVGARTKTQVVFQIDEERLIVKPNDWLLHTKEGWKKLSTPTEIDDYVSRKLVGALFIFQEIAKKDDKPVLIGSIYNPNRTEFHPIEVAMLPANGNATPSISPGNSPESPLNAATPIANH